MNQILDNFRKLMDKFGFVNPIQIDIQVYAINESEKSLKYTLKKVKDYSFVFGIILLIYCLPRKFGLGITFFQSKIAVAIIAVTLTVSSVAGGKYVKDYIIDKFSTPVESIEINIDNNVKDKIIKKEIVPRKKATIKLTQFTVGVNTFSGFNNELAHKITSRIISDLTEVIGKDKVTLISKSNRNSNRNP